MKTIGFFVILALLNLAMIIQADQVPDTSR